MPASHFPTSIETRCDRLADMSHGDPYHDRYRDYLNDPERGYVTTEIPLDAGLVISTRAPTGPA